MKVEIRPLIKEDAYTSVKWRNDPEVFKYTGSIYNHEITIEMELEWISQVISNKNDYRCAIIADGIYVGNIYLTDIENKKATYHIFIGDKTYWGKGVAKKASELLITYAFEILRLNQISLKVRCQNISAIHLYEKLGFKETTSDSEFIHMILEKCD